MKVKTPVNITKHIAFTPLHVVDGRKQLVWLTVSVTLVLFFTTACLEPTGPINIPAKDGLTITALPDQTKFMKDSPFETTGLDATLTYQSWTRPVVGFSFFWENNGTEQEISDGDKEITKVPGEKTVTVRYLTDDGKSFDSSFEVDVYAAGGIEVKSSPTLTEYPVGAPFETSGIGVVLYGDGWETDVTADVSYSDWEGDPLKDGDRDITSEAGAKVITVSYDLDGSIFHTSFIINVRASNLIVKNAKEWSEALIYIDTETKERNFDITLRGSFQIQARNSPGISRTDGIDVILRTLEGEKAKLSIEAVGNGSFLYVGERQTFIIDGEGLTFEGKTINEGPLIRVEGDNARLELRSGTITGNNNTSASGIPGASDLAGNGGGVRVANGGHFAMSGGAVSGNLANCGGGVAVYKGSFDMTGGSVSGNTVTDASGVYQGGGGVNIAEYSTFTMSGRSSISGNTAATMGAGIFVASGSTLTMLDESSVTGNECHRFGGGGVWLGNQNAGTLNMKGGIISGNSAQVGGGVYLWGQSLFQMENGIIYGKDAPSDIANSAPSSYADALRVQFGSACRGTFTRDSAGNDIFTTTDAFNERVSDTIRVKKGELVP
jgi:hypothetical protein